MMAPTTARIPSRSRAILLGSLVMLGACNGGTGPAVDTLRFAQLGEIRIQLIQPLQLGVGDLQQSLTWDSSGPWQLAERISYRGILGDEQVWVSEGDPDLLAAAYAQIITQLNETVGLDLFIDELDPLLDPPCGLTGTRVNLTPRDEGRNEEVTWRRCTTGNLLPVSS